MSVNFFDMRIKRFCLVENLNINFRSSRWFLLFATEFGLVFMSYAAIMNVDVELVRNT